MSNADSTMQRLEDQIDWYDHKSVRNQRAYKWLKGTEIVAAAVIAFSAGLETQRLFVAGLGVLIVIVEGLQHLNQYHHNWITYRSTSEVLKHEKYLYLALAGPYSSANDPRALLAERTESLISQEHAKWVSSREEAAKTKGAPGQGSG